MPLSDLADRAKAGGALRDVSSKCICLIRYPPRGKFQRKGPDLPKLALGPPKTVITFAVGPSSNRRLPRRCAQTNKDRSAVLVRETAVRKLALNIHAIKGGGNVNVIDAPLH